MRTSPTPATSIAALALVAMLLAIAAPFCLMGGEHAGHSDFGSTTHALCAAVFVAVALGLTVLLRPWAAGRAESAPLLAPGLGPVLALDRPPRLLPLV